MATFTERLELLITSTGTQAAKEINAVGSATTQLTAKQKALGIGQDFVNNQLSQFGVTASAAGTALKVAGVAAGALAAVKIGQFAFDAAEDFAQLGSEIRGVQRVTGTSAEDASRLVAVTKALGVNTDSAANGFFQLGKRIGQNKDTLEEHGAAIERNADGTVNMAKTIENAAVAFQKIKDPAERDAFILENFGRQGVNLIPILSKTRTELDAIFKSADEHHEILSQDDLDRTREFSLALRELGQTTTGLKRELGALVLPAFTGAAQGATEVITSFDKALGTVGGSLGDVGEGLGFVASEGLKTFTPLGVAIHGTSAATDLLAGHFGDAALEAAKMIPPVGVITDLFGIGGDEAATYADKQQELGDAVKKVADLEVQGKQGTKEYADAVKDAQEKSDAYAKSTKDVADALQTKTDKQYAAMQADLGANQARLTLQASVLNVKSALADEAKAQQDAADAAQFGVDQSADVQAANIKTQQAILGVIGAAQQRAVQALGPSASAEAQHKAALDATTDAVKFLALSIPGSVTALEGLGYKVTTLPDGSIAVTVEDDKARADLEAFNEYADAVTRARTLRVNFDLGQAINIPGYDTGGTVPGPRGAPQLILAHGGETVVPAGGRVRSMPGPPTTQTVINVTVAHTGLGVDSPRLQRDIVNALRGYTRRNGPIDVPVRS
jgi:hypothetical protein